MFLAVRAARASALRNARRAANGFINPCLTRWFACAHLAGLVTLPAMSSRSPSKYPHTWYISVRILSSYYNVSAGLHVFALARSLLVQFLTPTCLSLWPLFLIAPRSGDGFRFHGRGNVLPMKRWSPSRRGVLISSAPIAAKRVRLRLLRNYGNSRANTMAVWAT